MHNSATKHLSINNYQNSQDSSLTPNSTPPLTNNLQGNQAQPRSSQVLSYSNPTLEKEEASQNNNDANSDDEGFIPQLGTIIDRENRQTFASSHHGNDEPYH